MEIKCVFSPAVLHQQQRKIGAGVSEWKGTLFAKPRVSKVEVIHVEKILTLLRHYGKVIKYTSPALKLSLATYIGQDI